MRRHLSIRRLGFVLVALFAVNQRLALHAQPADWPLPAVLSRAATYVETYTDRMSGIVCEETSTQDVLDSTRFGYRQNMSRGPYHRALRADLLLVRPEGLDSWMQFRDVFEVDGRPLRDRNDRLARLFLTPSNSTGSQADKISRESARYNIGDIERTVNLPFLALSVLSRRTQSGFQFRFETESSRDPGSLPKSTAFTPPADAVVIAFEETAVRTMITTPQGKNLRAHGRFWLSLPTAKVLMTELMVDDFSLGASIHVAYQAVPALDLPVPGEMHELYENHVNKQRVESTSTYSNFREFNVKIDEQLAPIKGR